MPAGTPEEIRAAQAAAGVGQPGAKDQISEFYSALSAYLDTLFDDSRWASSGPYRSLREQEEEIDNMLGSLREIGLPEDVIEPIQFSRFIATALAEEYRRIMLKADEADIREYRALLKERQAVFDQRAEAWGDLVDSAKASPGAASAAERAEAG
jgi:hypothetical protein